MHRFTTMLIALMLLALAGCASTQAPVDDSDLRLDAASQAFGGRFAYMIIRSAGPLRDSLFVNLSKVTGSSDMARELATRLAAAERSELRILVSGQDGEKTMDVIRDAFAVHRYSRLPGLEFLFLGETRYEPEVRALVEATGGRMRFAPFEG